MLIYLFLAYLIFRKYKNYKVKSSKESGTQLSDSYKKYEKLLLFTVFFFIFSAAFSLMEYLLKKDIPLGDVIMVVAGILLITSIIRLDKKIEIKEESYERELDSKRKEILLLPKGELKSYLNENNLKGDTFNFTRDEDLENKSKNHTSPLLFPGEEEEVPK